VNAVRSANPCATYFEAAAKEVDLEAQRVTCESASIVRTNVKKRRFIVPYDYLCVAVGEMPATFGVPGVREHAFFMKEVSDTVAMRKRIATQFEAAEYLRDGEEAALRGALRFVVVGGGPTGVEFAGTLSDFLFNDVARAYKRLLPFAEVVLVQSGGTILPVFDNVLQRRAAQNLEKLKVRVLTGVRVRGRSFSAVFAVCMCPLWHALCTFVRATISYFYHQHYFPLCFLSKRPCFQAREVWHVQLLGQKACYL
jgi:NADH:ubiquinone reductase (non-electrogenic)